MLDEGTAVVEGMLLARRVSGSSSNVFLVDADALPQTKALLRNRAAAVGIVLVESDLAGDLPESFGAFMQYPGATGRVWDPSAVIAAVQAQGGVAIANHPARDYWSGWTDEAVSLLDGYERVHPSMRTPANAADFAAFSARAVRLQPGIAAIGSSDFHTGGHPGWCRTWVLTRERSVAGVIAAVRDGRTVAVDMNGALYGSPEAIGIVTASGVSAPLPQESGTWQRLSVAAAWLGLLGLALL